MKIFYYTHTHDTFEHFSQFSYVPLLHQQKTWGLALHRFTSGFMNNFLDKWNDITKLDRDFLRIDDDSAYQLNYINFNIDTVRLTCTERLVDELGNTYNIKKLYSC